MTTLTDTILREINVLKLKQKDVALTCAMAIVGDMNAVNWETVMSAIAERWSLSARERVLGMAWKIVERMKAAE